MCFYFAPQLSLTDTSTKPCVSAPGKIIKKPSIMDSHKSLAALWASFAGASSLEKAGQRKPFQGAASGRSEQSL